MSATRKASRTPARAPMRTLAAREARLLLLAGCGLAQAPRPATAATVLRTVRELGFVQVDSIAAVERAHH
ncbi:MAG: hypothetical protein ACO3IB_11850, partial [Phycisphaerales bacterium]